MSSPATPDWESEDLGYDSEFVDLNLISFLEKQKFNGLQDENGEFLSPIERSSLLETWLLRLELGFKVFNVSEDLKTSFVILAVDGDTKHWLGLEEKAGRKLKDLSWDEFKEKMKTEYHKNPDKDTRYYLDQFFELRWEPSTTFSDYNSKFEKLRAQCCGELNNHGVVAKYIHGLPHFVRRKIDLEGCTRVWEVQKKVLCLSSEWKKPNRDVTYGDSCALRPMHHHHHRGFKTKGWGHRGQHGGYKRHYH